MKKTSVSVLVALVSMVIAAGCANKRSGENEPLVATYMTEPVASAPAGGRDARDDIFADDIVVGTRPVDPRDRKKLPCVGCGVTITGKASKMSVMPILVSQPALPPDIAMLEATTRPSVVPALIPPAPANPLHALKRGSAIGSLDGHGFGYNLDQLVYNPWWSPTKSVAMGEQKFPLTIPCEKHLLQDTLRITALRDSRGLQDGCLLSGFSTSPLARDSSLLSSGPIISGST